MGNRQPVIQSHFSPQSYLRSWVNDDGQLVAIDLERESLVEFRVHVKKVATERHFYKLRRADGTLSDHLEHELAKFDGMIPRIIERARADVDLTPEDFDNLRALYANLAARGHLGRDMLVGEVQSAHERFTRDYASQFPGDPPDRRNWAVDYVIRGGFDHPEDYAADPDTISRLALPQRAEDIRKKMPPYICVLNLKTEAFEFITSDAPFTKFYPEASADDVEHYARVFAEPRVELTLTLGRLHAVLFSNARIPERAYINAIGAAVINARTVRFAHRMIFQHCGAESEGLAMATLATLKDRDRIPLLTPLLEGLDR